MTHHKKRAKKAGVPYARYSRSEVVYLPTHCAICGKPYQRGDKRSLDHIIPLSHGGLDTRDNVQSAHKTCNELKNHQMQTTPS